MKVTSIKKKLRGMRRRARKLPLWGIHHQNLDIESLIENKKDYVKLWISPFYNLYQININEIGKKNPPHRFRKQVIYQLIEIYLEWQRKLDLKNEHYYLKIWLGDPEFMDSQVVTALGTEIQYYERIFLMNPNPKLFPYQNVHPCFELFTWERCVNGYYVWECDLESEEEINEMKSKAFKVYEDIINGQSERSYFISTGDMWTGQIRGSGNIT